MLPSALGLTPCCLTQADFTGGGVAATIAAANDCCADQPARPCRGLDLLVPESRENGVVGRCGCDDESQSMDSGDELRDDDDLNTDSSNQLFNEDFRSSDWEAPDSTLCTVSPSSRARVRWAFGEMLRPWSSMPHGTTRTLIPVTPGCTVMDSSPGTYTRLRN